MSATGATQIKGALFNEDPLSWSGGRTHGRCGQLLREGGADHHRRSARRPRTVGHEGLRLVRRVLQRRAPVHEEPLGSALRGLSARRVRRRPPDAEPRFRRQRNRLRASRRAGLWRPRHLLRDGARGEGRQALLRRRHPRPALALPRWYVHGGDDAHAPDAGTTGWRLKLSSTTRRPSPRVGTCAAAGSSLFSSRHS